MVEPRIQYCTTPDGVNIAYTRVGSGPPVLYSDFGVRFLAIVAGKFLLQKVLADVSSVSYFDFPGTGASDRSHTDFSAQTAVRVHEAVADASMPGRPFTFIGGGGYAFGALYSAAHPERVERLIFLDPVPPSGPWFKATAGEWSAARRAMASMVFPEGPAERQRWWSNAVRDSVSEDTWRAAAAEYQTLDQQAAFARVRVPTLFVTGKREALRQHTARLAALVPGSQLVVTGATGSVADDRDAVRAILEFMGIDPACVGEDPRGQAAVILFTDIADSTALTERLGDAAFRAASRALDERLRTAMRDAGGSPVDGKVLGDGVMATFASAAQAIDAARQSLAISSESQLPIHIGIHAGDVIREPGNVYGGSVNIASRICAMSTPGEILVSDVVRGMARSSAGVTFEDRGEHALKGIAEPVRVYAVQTQT